MFKGNHRWLIVAWLVFIGMIAYFDRVNFSMSAPVISKEFGMDPAQLGIIMSGFTIGYMVSNFPGGLLAARFQSRLIISVILVGWSIMTLLTGYVWSFVSLLSVRIIFGIFEGPLFPNGYKIINLWTLPKDRGLAAGFYVTLAPLGIVIGNLISGFIITAYGWRSVFYIFGGFGVILGLISWFILRDYPEEYPAIDKKELELIKSSQAAFDGKVVETSTGSTVGQLLSNPWAWIMTLNYFTFTLVFWANINWLPTYFIKARGSNLMTAGMNSSIPWIAMILGLLTIGRLADKVGKKYKSPWQAFSLFMMVPTISYAVITPFLTTCLISFSIATFFVGGAMGLINALNFDLFSKADVPKVSGLMLTGAAFAGIIAPILVGYVLKETGSFNGAYFVFSGIAFIGGLLGLALFYKEKKLRAERQSSF